MFIKMVQTQFFCFALFRDLVGFYWRDHDVHYLCISNTDLAYYEPF